MKKILLTTMSGILLISAAMPMSVWSKNETAPGQIKKLEKQTLQTGEQEATTTLRFQNGKSQNMLRLAAKQLTQRKKGKAMLQDLLNQLATDSARTGKALKGKKIGHIRLGKASSSAELKRHAIGGVISAINGQTLTITHQKQLARSYQVQLGSTTIVTQKGATESASIQLAIGQRIIAIGTPEKGILLASRIHIIPGKAHGIPPLPTISIATGSPTIVPTDTITPTEGISPTISEPTPTVIPTETISVTPSVTSTPEPTITPAL